MTQALFFRKSHVIRVRGRNRCQATSGHSLFRPRCPADSIHINLAFADKLAVDVVLGSWAESHVSVGIRVISPSRWVLSPLVLFHGFWYLLVHDHDLHIAEMSHVRDGEQKVRQLAEASVSKFQCSQGLGWSAYLDKEQVHVHELQLGLLLELSLFLEAQSFRFFAQVVAGELSA